MPDPNKGIAPSVRNRLAEMLAGASAGAPQLEWLHGLVEAAGYNKAKRKANKAGRKSHGGDMERAAVRRAQALELRLGGENYEKIAEKLGVNKSTAIRDVRHELDALAAINEGKASSLRALELARLDKLQAGLLWQVQDGSVPAVLASLKIMERRARLLGLDLAPEPIPQVNLNMLTMNDPKMQVILQSPEAADLLMRLTGNGKNGNGHHNGASGGDGLEAVPGDDGGEHQPELPPLPARPAP